MAKSNDKMDNQCHIPDLVQALSNVENVGFCEIVSFVRSVPSISSFHSHFFIDLVFAKDYAWNSTYLNYGT